MSPPAFANSFFRHIHVEDVTDHAHAVAGWDVTLDQLSSGVFRGEVMEVSLDGIQLVRERMNCAVLKRGRAWEGSVVLSIPNCNDAHARCAGIDVGGAVAMFANGECLPELRTPSAHDVMFVTVSAESLAKLSSLKSQATGIQSVCVTKLDHGRHALLRTSLENVVIQTYSCAYLPRSTNAMRALRDAVLLELSSLAEDASAVEVADLRSRRQIVEKVRELVLDNPNTPYTVLDLCLAVGASRRKLQYCFEDVLGVNPALYVRTLRLNAVRRDLLSDPGRNRRVGDIAADWGFWHQSRFSFYYKELFGELPSQTTGKQRCSAQGSMIRA